MSQVEIGAKMEMSRWKIGRVIKDARERGLVTITINHPQVDLTETEIKIAQKFGINEAKSELNCLKYLIEFVKNSTWDLNLA
jgi:deoxyribonucleoside regulator